MLELESGILAAAVCLYFVCKNTPQATLSQGSAAEILPSQTP